MQRDVWGLRQSFVGPGGPTGAGSLRSLPGVQSSGWHMKARQCLGLSGAPFPARSQRSSQRGRCLCSSPPTPLPHPLRSQSPPWPPPPGPLSGRGVPAAPHPLGPAALAAAVGRPAGPPDPAGAGGWHAARWVLALSAPVPGAACARLSRWPWEGVVSEQGQRGLSAPPCPSQPPLGATVLVAVPEGLTSSAAGGTVQSGRERRGVAGHQGAGPVGQGSWGSGAASAGLDGGRGQGVPGLWAALQMPQGPAGTVSPTLGGEWWQQDLHRGPQGSSSGHSHLLRAHHGPGPGYPLPWTIDYLPLLAPCRPLLGSLSLAPKVQCSFHGFPPLIQ